MNTVKGLTDRVLLMILDGYGINPGSIKNAIQDAKKPTLDKLFSTFPYTQIEAGGVEVGLPKGVSGNSEVGHLNLGAGRPVRQDLVRINEAIENDTLKDVKGLETLISKTQENSGKLHLMGLLSDGGVHSHIDHLKALIDIFKEQGIEVYFHAYMDGRDTPKHNGVKYIEKLLGHGGVKLASMQGRSIGMDRDRRWEKIERAYNMMIGKGDKTDLSPVDYIKNEYAKDIYDEFITPVLFDEAGAITANDSLFFINFRPDRAKQISLAFNKPDFKEFKNEVRPAYFLCMTPYFEPEEIELPILFDKEKVKGGLAEYLSKLGKGQFKIAETEKYAHVTYFFNGGNEEILPGEERKLIPSPRDVETYDLKPEMNAEEVTNNLVEALGNKDFSFYLVNYANPDMVGHTGNYEATVKAIEFLDGQIARIIKKCEEEGVALIVTADHGNADEMLHIDGTPHTAHSGAPVPVCLYHKELTGAQNLNKNEDFALKDIAATVLHLLDIEKPSEFSGQSIFN